MGCLDLSYRKCVSCKHIYSKSQSHPKLYTFSNFKNFNVNSFQLVNSVLNEIFYTQDNDDKLSILLATLMSLFEKHVPVWICKRKSPSDRGYNSYHRDKPNKSKTSSSFI